MAVNLNNIKEQIKVVLDAANTTTATFDLSTGLARRVQRVLKVNPARIKPQASFFPFISCYAESKDINLADMAGSQLNAKRFGEISFNIVGAVWSPMISDINENQGDEEIETLLENIEENIRRNPTLNNTVLWTRPNAISFGTGRIGSSTDQVAIGVLDLVCKVAY